MNIVEQEAFQSPVLVGVFNDNLLMNLAEAKLGCFFGNAYLGVLACADEIVLTATCPVGMPKLYL
jgi:hypothetical protein